jgi:methylated-DNA-protein-cysteine methyltransferase-like protein
MDLDALPLEQQQSFCRGVWMLARLTPYGKVVTYGQIGAYLPCPEGVKAETYQAFRARWVGSAMATCPAGVPWQRVINAQGMISARRGAENQRRLLEAEGVVFNARDRIDLAVYGWSGPTVDWLEENGLIPPAAPSLF